MKFPVCDADVESRLETFRKYVAKHIPPSPDWKDPGPACAIDDGCVLIGNKYHAADLPNLLKLGVTAVLNCASGGISRLPVEELQESGIRYAFTNCRQDDYSYPILHDKEGTCSKHLEVAKALYEDVLLSGGKVLFFCVAGQNRSAALAIAVLMLFGHPLDAILQCCSKTRPFILENVGFQRQLVELEFMLKGSKMQKLRPTGPVAYLHGTLPSSPYESAESDSDADERAGLVEIELLIPGLCTMDVKIPVESTIATVKKCLIDHANKYLLSVESKVASSWMVLAMFGYDSMYDFPLEVESIELDVQLERMKSMFNLEVLEGADPKVRWNSKCRFALVIFSVTREHNGMTIQVPWTFVHEERPGAPATLLQNTLMSTHLRAWDFVTGQAYCSHDPIVFSYATDPADRRSFMKISTSANEAQQFHAPGEGGILGMGANAIVHRVQLVPTSAEGRDESSKMAVDLSSNEGWDAAVKRPFSLDKMLGMLKNSSEAGMAKRVRSANLLNSDGRVLYFYGLGVALSANADNQQEYKFEATLLARYEEEFSTYTMRKFMEDYIAIPDQAPDDTREEIIRMQSNFSLISVKVLLVSLLNAFRDLSLMGLQAFDFNLNNVLISRDFSTVKLLDIDGNSRGSIQFPSEYITGSGANSPRSPRASRVHKPSLDVDLNVLLPTIVQQLILGKGRGKMFVTDKKSEIWRAKTEDAKAMIKDVIRSNFFCNNNGEEESWKDEKHLSKLAEWFYTSLKKRAPWQNWTNDIYDAMRCIDHLPIT